MKIHLVAAARPNFMKIAPLHQALLAEPGLTPVLVHTGQHYDLNMSDIFFRELGLAAPDVHLGAGGGSHAQQTAKVMVAYEELLQKDPPALVVVPGDVNSTLACALAAVKLQIPVAHLEAGLRSFDRSMPEEINRIVTDSISDLLWTPSPDGDEQLRREGVPPEKIVRVGNIMIDSLAAMLPAIEARAQHRELGLSPGGYGVVTLHRPSNVDHPASLEKLCLALAAIARTAPLVFPVHPRTSKNLEAFGLKHLLEEAPGVFLTQPLGYLAFMSLVKNAGLAISDSGGVQEETTWLGIPCLTLRENTERPITISQGTNRLCRVEELPELAARALRQRPAPRPPIELWDGKTASRVVRSIREFLA